MIHVETCFAHNGTSHCLQYTSVSSRTEFFCKHGNVFEEISLCWLRDISPAGVVQIYHSVSSPSRILEFLLVAAPRHQNLMNHRIFDKGFLLASNEMNGKSALC